MTIIMTWCSNRWCDAMIDVRKFRRLNWSRWYLQDAAAVRRDEMTLYGPNLRWGERFDGQSRPQLSPTTFFLLQVSLVLVGVICRGEKGSQFINAFVKFFIVSLQVLILLWWQRWKKILKIYIQGWRKCLHLPLKGPSFGSVLSLSLQVLIVECYFRDV